MCTAYVLVRRGDLESLLYRAKEIAALPSVARNVEKRSFHTSPFVRACGPS